LLLKFFLFDKNDCKHTLQSESASEAKAGTTVNRVALSFAVGDCKKRLIGHRRFQLVDVATAEQITN